MKNLPLFLFASFLTAGCIAGLGPFGSGSHPVEWPEGVFVLEGTVEYERSSSFGRRAVTEVIEAEVSIASGGQMSMESSAGPCREPEPAQIRAQQRKGFRSFTCGTARYEIRPEGSTLEGSITADIPTFRRERGECLRWSRIRSGCIEYAYSYQEGTERKTIPLRVSRME